MSAGSLILSEGVGRGSNSSSDHASGSGVAVAQGNSQGYVALRHPGFGDEVGPAQCPALDFVEHHHFQLFIGSTIGANTVVLAAETDHPLWEGWVYFDNLFLIIFLVEIILRILHRGPTVFFTGKDKWWSLLDFVMVVDGVWDSWMLPLLSSSGLLGTNSVVTRALRPLRLLRLLRLLRAFRLFPKLMVFAKALLAMFGTMVWIFVVLLIVLVCWAIILTRQLGQGDYLRADTEEELADIAGIQGNFRDVSTSFFTLFQVVTQDNWYKVARPLCNYEPAWKFFFVVFIVFASWTMVSVLTAVASESMVQATSDRKEEELKAQEAKAKEFIDFLHDAFKKADADGNGLLDWHEFSDMMQKDFVLSRMKSLGVTMAQEEMNKIWGLLDVKGEGELELEDFVAGLAYLQEKLTTRHVVQLDYQLKRMSLKLVANLDNLCLDLDALDEQSQAIMASLRRQQELSEVQHSSLWMWQRWIANHDPQGYPPGQLPDLERLPRVLEVVRERSIPSSSRQPSTLDTARDRRSFDAR